MSTLSYEQSPCQSNAVQEVENHLQEILTRRAERLAKETGFVQRRFPITGAAFARMLVFGFLSEPQAGSTDLQQMLDGLRGFTSPLKPSSSA